MKHLHPALPWLGIPILLMVVLLVLLGAERPLQRPLVVYTAASLRPVMQTIANDYHAEFNRRVVLRAGGSETILTQARFSVAVSPGDLFLPADEGYLQTASELNLIGESRRIARMNAVVLAAPVDTRDVSNWRNLTSLGTKIALAEPDVAAIGLLTKEHLLAQGLWDEFAGRIVVRTDTVNQAANATKLNTVDAAIVWDAVARAYPDQRAYLLPEFAGVIAHVSVAMLKQSPEPDQAAHLLNFISQEGKVHFQSAGFEVLP